MDYKTVLSWAGVVLVAIIAIIVALSLFGVSLSKISFSDPGHYRRAQVYSSRPDSVKRIDYKGYKAPINVSAY